jgi:hypothetical protein
MVKHVAYKGDLKHEEWRVSHELPVIIPFGHHNDKKYKLALRMAVVREFNR